MAWLPLGLGLGLMLGLTAYPRLLVGADGQADHVAATLACWAMAAGLTRGVGYVPANAWARRSGGKLRLIIDNAAGPAAAPREAPSSRAAINAGALHATIAAAEKTATPMMLIKYTRRAP